MNASEVCICWFWYMHTPNTTKMLNITVILSWRWPFPHTQCLSVLTPPTTGFRDNLFSIFIPNILFSCSVMSNSLRSHGLQHARPPCPSPTPGIYSNPCPLSRWCHPTISSSVVPFSSRLQSFPVSGSFQMSQFFTSCGQSIRVAASTSVLSMNIQDWFPLGWTGWISL